MTHTLPAHLKTVFLLAGGTGGHLFPAYSLAQELQKRGMRAILLTDTRGKQHVDSFHFDDIYTIPSATLAKTSFFNRIKALFTLIRGIFAAFKVIRKEKPDAIVGFGGYPIVPSGIASVVTHTPLLLHEQNGVMGRANRFLERYARAIATGFPRVLKTTPSPQRIVIHTGNPVRSEILTFMKSAFHPPQEGEAFRLLIFGGSQGASIMGSVVPEGIALLPPDFQKRLTIMQQARPDSCEAVRKAYKGLGIPSEVSPFFSDMPARMAMAHLIISRSGASTVTELSLLKRPCILVPLPQSLDQDQKENAKLLSENQKDVIVVEQHDFTPKHLSTLLVQFMVRAPQASAPGIRSQNEEQLTYPNAAERLANLVSALINDPSLKEFYP
jgi:UDP-N-acetylglucosamine--N-acetylmuramyl-(pentapeptide) pyrophosphoryl-undecaprenol N-acetylglucosamine transferase